MKGIIFSKTHQI